MADSLESFDGVVIRVDGGGFGIVEFEATIDSARHGFFTETTRNFRQANDHLRVGGRISGLAARTSQNVLPVTEFSVD